MTRIRPGIVHTSPLGALRRRGRPLGEIAQQMLRQIESSPATMPSLAARLQVSYGVAKVTVSRLVAAGHARYGEPVPGQGVRPPRLVHVGGQSGSDTGALEQALRAWVRG